MADIHDLDENTDPQSTDELYILDDPAADPTDERLTVLTLLTKFDLIGGLERSADPDAPAEGYFVIWMSDGTGVGDDGDVMIASTAGGATKYGTLFDHSAGSAFS